MVNRHLDMKLQFRDYRGFGLLESEGEFQIMLLRKCCPRDLEKLNHSKILRVKCQVSRWEEELCVYTAHLALHTSVRTQAQSLWSD
jgi:hypothetical protein